MNTSDMLGKSCGVTQKTPFCYNKYAGIQDGRRSIVFEFFDSIKQKRIRLLLHLSCHIDIINVTNIGFGLGVDVFNKKQSGKDKIDALRREGTLNPSPEKVQDSLFQEKDFFDANDVIQVKYEMLRRVTKEGSSITEASRNFGFSRLSFYRTLAIFGKLGLAGFVPQRRGPKEAHKLSAEVMRFVEDQVRENASVSISVLKSAIEKRFNLSVHARSIERALARRKKKRTAK